MKYDADKPCTSCPYRRDVAVGVWHPSHYDRLLQDNRDEVGGATYQCHLSNALLKDIAGFCIGWLLDQKRRGTPSIQLRLKLMTEPEACDQFGRINDDGVELYDSVEEMCLANVGQEFPKHDRKARQLKKAIGKSRRR